METYRQWRTAALVAVIGAGLAGCAATNPCNGRHGGLCAPSREIWGVTRNRDQVNPTAKTVEAQRDAARLIREKPSKNDKLPPISAINIIGKGGAAAAGKGKLLQGAYPAKTGPEPLLRQPKIEKVWVAPWTRGNTLHFPGYLYTIVTPEKWVFAPARGETPVPAPER